MSGKLNRRARIYLIATVISVALVSMGIALAYFAADIQGTGTTDLNVTVSSNPFLTFKTDGEGIALTVSAENFYEDGYDIAGTTSSTATLEADGSVVSATYNVYFKITKNELDYSSENVATYTDPEPELILVITTTDDKETSYVIPEGYEAIEYVIKNEDGTTTEVTGIDITNSIGTLNVAIDHEITIAEGEEHSQDWTATIYFINLDVNQIDNSGKSFEAEFILGELPTLSETIIMNNGSQNDSVVSYETAIAYIEDKGNPDFTQSATTDEGMYATEDIYGETTYYFRGAVEDNYVYQWGILWRIIRIDENGNIKLIVEEADYNNYTYSVFIGEMGGSIDTISFEGSQIQQTIESYVSSQIKIYSFDAILVESNYCIDDSVITDYEILNTLKIEGVEYIFNSLLKFYTSSPSLKCDEEDIYSYTSGLISSDEIVFAGLSFYEANADFYLNFNSATYWTLSVAMYSSNTGYVWAYDADILEPKVVFENMYILRPVITIDGSRTDFFGSGTYDDPYYYNMIQLLG